VPRTLQEIEEAYADAMMGRHQDPGLHPATLARFSIRQLAEEEEKWKSMQYHLIVDKLMYKLHDKGRVIHWQVSLVG